MLLNHNERIFRDVALRAAGSSALERQTAESTAFVQPQTAGSTASARTVAVREDKSAGSGETWSEDGVLRVVAKRAKQCNPLFGFERRTLVAALIRDLPCWSNRYGKTNRRTGGRAPTTHQRGHCAPWSGSARASGQQLGFQRVQRRPLTRR